MKPTDNTINLRDLLLEPGFANYGKQLIVAVGTVILSWAACLATVLIICALLTILGKSMSYYSMPTLVVFLYALPGFLAILAVHRVVRSTMYKVSDCLFPGGIFVLRLPDSSSR